MPYCTAYEVDFFLGQALTSARPDSTNQKIRLINIGNVRDPNRIPTDVVEYYINSAQSHINGVLSQMYQYPFKECAMGHWTLQSPISVYNQTVEITDSTSLLPGNKIIIRDDDADYEETHIISEIVDQYSFLTEDTMGDFDGDNVRVILLSVPHPINQITARLAASYIYDKYFSAQNSPNVSDYGKELRNYAMGQLNDILNGRTILREPCARRVGDQFGNPYLDSSYALREPPGGWGSNDRNMSKI